MEEQTGVLEDYIKKGLEKGFSLNYIKEILIKHGHESGRVNTAANNISGLKYPNEFKKSIEGEDTKRTRGHIIFPIVIIILLLITGFFTVDYFLQKGKIVEVKSQLEQIRDLGLDIDNLSEAMKEQAELIKEKELTIEEKEEIIEQQIQTIDQINIKIKEQKTKINDLILDIMNRMIGRMSG